ncbi:MAG: hypothetical protein OYL97_13565 [Candidatus Poribacteria bacterium]|nr:hypothetical protein [Candidatus Poribacteria bacterium]
MRFLSPNKQKQETARFAGGIVSFVGAMLVMSGYRTEDLFLVGALLLIWYGMSWFVYRTDPEKITHWLQQLWYFLLFLVFSVLCGVIAAYLPGWIAHEIAGILINLVVFFSFPILLFCRGGSSKSDTS